MSVATTEKVTKLSQLLEKLIQRKHECFKHDVVSADAVSDTLERLKLRGVSSVLIGMALSRIGAVNAGQVRLNKKKVRAWVIRNKDQWQFACESALAEAIKEI